MEGPQNMSHQQYSEQWLSNVVSRYGALHISWCRDMEPCMQLAFQREKKKLPYLFKTSCTQRQPQWIPYFFCFYFGNWLEIKCVARLALILEGRQRRNGGDLSCFCQRFSVVCRAHKLWSKQRKERTDFNTETLCSKLQYSTSLIKIIHNTKYVSTLGSISMGWPSIARRLNVPRGGASKA